MSPSDVEHVVRIEADAFTSPWKADTFHTLLERPGAELWVLAEPEAGVVAYAVVWSRMSWRTSRWRSRIGGRGTEAICSLGSWTSRRTGGSSRSTSR